MRKLLLVGMILLALAGIGAASAATNLVKNGGFEEPRLGESTGCRIPDRRASGRVYYWNPWCSDLYQVYLGTVTFFYPQNLPVFPNGTAGTISYWVSICIKTLKTDFGT
jgi:hypothetical protein